MMRQWSDSSSDCLTKNKPMGWMYFSLRQKPKTMKSTISFPHIFEAYAILVDAWPVTVTHHIYLPAICVVSTPVISLSARVIFVCGGAALSLSCHHMHQFRGRFGYTYWKELQWLHDSFCHFSNSFVHVRSHTCRWECLIQSRFKP